MFYLKYMRLQYFLMNEHMYKTFTFYGGWVSYMLAYKYSGREVVLSSCKTNLRLDFQRPSQETLARAEVAACCGSADERDAAQDRRRASRRPETRRRAEAGRLRRGQGPLRRARACDRLGSGPRLTAASSFRWLVPRLRAHSYARSGTRGRLDSAGRTTGTC